MSWASWLALLLTLVSPRRQSERRSPGRPRSFKPSLECLEERWTPNATFTFNSGSFALTDTAKTDVTIL